MAYRADLDALAARVRSLDEEVDAATRARDEAQRVYDDTVARATLPMLQGIQVAAPCNEDWSKMAGDERVRHCTSCKQNVYDLSAMTETEAETLVGNTEGRLCVRFFQRTDGTILTSDCAVGIRRRRRHQVFAAAALALGTSAAATMAVGMTRMGTVRRPTPQSQPGQVRPAVEPVVK